MIPTLDDDESVAIFEERAEYLNAENFTAWLEVGPFERQVLRALTSRGPKLLVGPRGCGKSTLLRLAKERMSERGLDMPVLVNYARSLCLEPAFKQRPDAEAFFQDWLAARILAEVPEPRTSAGADHKKEIERARAFVREAESDPLLKRGHFPGPAALAHWLESYANTEKYRNVTLLLDDAAHAFVPEQQKLFFNFVAGIRRPRVTYKAAIYPGVTEFAPTFNVGHDAKVINAWIPSDSPDYLPFMRALLKRRLPDRGGIAFSDELVDLFAVAAFGVPRNFIAMVEMFLEAKPTPARVTQVALQVLKTYSDQTVHNYEQLAVKLPPLGNYIQAGLGVRSNIIRSLDRFNREKRGFADAVKEQALEIAIEEPVDARVVTILNLMEYWGIVRRTHETFSSSQRQYTKIAINSGTLLAESALNYGQNPSIASRALAATKKTRQHSYLRVKSSSLLTPELADMCVLANANCAACGATPQAEGQRFCANCGSPLASESRYERLVQASVSELALPEKKILALEEIGMSRVEDILRDKGGVELRRARRVGDVWTRRITGRAEEFISV
ncbi:MAG: hypothetical protein IPL94_02390 [Tetrasphaera sp.]|nr:hypothetical protein [Tetrasphaera sp.]